MGIMGDLADHYFTYRIPIIWSIFEKYQVFEHVYLNIFIVYVIWIKILLLKTITGLAFA